MFEIPADERRLFFAVVASKIEKKEREREGINMNKHDHNNNLTMKANDREGRRMKK